MLHSVFVIIFVSNFITDNLDSMNIFIVVIFDKFDNINALTHYKFPMNKTKQQM